MVKRIQHHRHVRPLVVLVAALALVAGCTNDMDWSGGSNPGGETDISRLPHPVSANARIELVGFVNCESDLRELQEARRQFREDQERHLRELEESYAADGTVDDSVEQGSAGSFDADMGSSAAVGTGAGTESSGRVAPQPTMGDAQKQAGDVAEAGPAIGSGTTSETSSGDTSGEVIAGTNVGEEGVDEADIIKTDGRRIITLRGGVLRVTVLDDDPGIDGALRLDDVGYDVEMYVVGDTVTVIGGGGYPMYRGSDTALIGPTADIAYGYTEGATLTQVDISDPTKPAVVDTVAVDGTINSSRSVGGRIHVVMTSHSADVLPQISYDGAEPTELGDCSDVRYESDVDDPVEPSDSSDAPSAATDQPLDGPTVSILSFTNLSDGIEPTVVTGSGGIVYGSTESLYVASSLWNHDADGTAVHRFALTNDGPVDYIGSAVVPGELLNQFSISEYGSTLRVVTNVQSVFGAEPAWSGELDDSNGDAVSPSVDTAVDDGPVLDDAPVDDPGLIKPDVRPAPDEEPMVVEEPDIAIAPAPGGMGTRVTTLRISNMAELGHLDGIAPGESLRSVRFIGTMGYVVTFEQVDPLFAIDLSDPSNPVVLGELKIPGFSEYLHPVGDGLLLGIGRDVDPMSAVDQGLKVSLFDVTDPHTPREVDTWTSLYAESPVAWDHHAFTWDPVNRNALFPVDMPCGTTTTRPGEIIDGTARTESSAPVAPLPSDNCAATIVMSVSGSSLTESAWISHQADGVSIAAPDRAVVVANNIWTLSDAGLGVSPVGDPARVHLIRF